MDEQKKKAKVKREVKLQADSSNIHERTSAVAFSRFQDSRSRLHGPRQSQVRDFKKTKVKVNTLNSISHLNIEQQIKKQLSLANELLKQHEGQIRDKVHRRNLLNKNEKYAIFHLQDLIKHKDELILQLTGEIEHLKKSQKSPQVQESNEQTIKNTTDCSDKQKLFKLAQELRVDRQQLSRYVGEHVQRYNNYLKIKRMIEQIQNKYARNDILNKDIKGQYYQGMQKMITYEQFKQKMRDRKRQEANNNKVKKIDFYHFNPLDKNVTPNKNMKDLMVRKTITLAALKNSKKKHSVQMNQLIAKIEFLKDEDLLLNQKIREKEHQLEIMENKFSETKRDNQIIRQERNALMNYGSG